MIHIVNLSEFSLARFLILVMLRRRVYVLGIETVFPQLDRFVRAVAEWSIRGGRTRWVIELCPELKPEWDYPPRGLIHNVFAQTETWQNDHYEFAKADLVLSDYAYAYKQATCCHTWKKHLSVLLLRSILRDPPDQDLKIVGLPGDGKAMAGILCRRDLGAEACPGRVSGRLTNLAILLLNLIYGTVFVLARLKPFGVAPRALFLAADYMFDPRDVRLYQELDEGGPTLLVYRIAPPDTKKFPELSAYEYCKPSDGAYSLTQAVNAIAIVLGGCLKMFRHFSHLDPGHFYKVAALPNRRAALRGLFNRFHPRYFWGRDPYNVQHILRRQELNRVGGQSLGLLEAIPVYTILFPHLRYVSFDRLYLWGRPGSTEPYADTWSEDMTLVPTASYSVTHEHLAARANPRSRDIAVFTAIYVVEMAMIELVRGIATAFPARRILLQVKGNFIETDAGKEFVAACTRGLSNVFHVRDSVYDLALRVKYVVSDPSSIFFEAIQVGAYSFAADFSHKQPISNLRNYPGLTVASAKDLAERILDIESGNWTYPIESCRELVDLSERVCRDVVRADVGLPDFTPPPRFPPLAGQDARAYLADKDSRSRPRLPDSHPSQISPSGKQADGNDT